MTDPPTYAVCARCQARATAGLNRGGGRYLLKPCGHVARILIITDEEDDR